MSIDILDSVYTVWSEAPHDHVLFKRNAIFFDLQINLSMTTSAFNAFPATAAAGNNVYVVWQGLFTGRPFPEILYRRSTDGGMTLVVL
jgi:hypothetical protein